MIMTSCSWRRTLVAKARSSTLNFCHLSKKRHVLPLCLPQALRSSCSGEVDPSPRTPRLESASCLAAIIVFLRA
jgi:hypothetical protein